MITYSYNSAPSARTWVVPFVQTADLDNQLADLAQRLGLPTAHIQADFKAKSKEILLVYPANAADRVSADRVYLVGLGKAKTGSDIAAAMRSFSYKTKQNLPGQISLLLSAGGAESYTEDIVTGFLLGNYEIGFLKNTAEKTTTFFDKENATLEIVANQPAETAVNRGQMLAETQARLLRVVDSPANYKTPQQLAEFVQESGRAYGYKVTIFDEQQCFEHGLHALLAVGKGSVENRPRFIIMEYRSEKPDAPTVGLVGKGVTFDTGGISIKPSDGMQYMKSDMGGAAAVIGTIEVVAKRQLPVNLIAIVPATENCVDALAIKPGDVIQSYSGKSIEVIDTDAEGRLILADGLFYMQKHFKPEVMIDLATLTGSCIRSLGYVAAGLMTSNSQLSEELFEAGLASGEKLWPLPLWDDYKDQLNSDIADIKNLTAAPLAGATTAAKFLEAFVNEHPKWAHIDIAGTAFGDSEFGKSKSATAFGIRLLTHWLEANYVRD